MSIALLLLGAGSASRMRGADKLLEDVDGQPCLRVLSQRGLEAGLKVYVTLRPEDAPRRNALARLDVTVIDVPDAAQGMSRSLRAGAAAMPNKVSGMMVLPGDMPEITADDMRAMVSGFESAPCMALRAVTEAGEPGHPIIFARETFASFAELNGDKGASGILKQLGHQVQTLALPGNRARLDLDTPEAWAEWRAGRR
ncbi:MAG: NTP transferase domain-containing protein [Paracoccaceae bacterium]